MAEGAMREKKRDLGDYNKGSSVFVCVCVTGSNWRKLEF